MIPLRHLARLNFFWLRPSPKHLRMASLMSTGIPALPEPRCEWGPRHVFVPHLRGTKTSRDGRASRVARRGLDCDDGWCINIRPAWASAM